MRLIGIALVFVCIVNVCAAHYNMLLPDKPWANKDEKVTFTYQFGHPFEHQLFDAPKPAALVVITPKGKKETFDIDKVLTPIKKESADGKKMSAWQFTFTPSERGDYTFAIKTPKIKIDDGNFIEDIVKVVLHVQTQNGWDTPVDPFEGSFNILPYTRPYGLIPGTVFRGRVVPVVPQTVMVETEKYNAAPLKNLPPDELVTFKAKADRDGFFVTTLPEPGWWAVTGIAQTFTVGEGKEAHHMSRRVTFWLHVDEKK